MLLLAVVAVHLYRAAKARNPDEPSWWLNRCLRTDRVRAQHARARRHAHDPGRRLRRAASSRRKGPRTTCSTPGAGGRDVSAYRVAGARLLAGEGVAGRDAARSADAIHGSARIALGPAFVLGFGSVRAAAVADRPGRAVPGCLAARPATGMEDRTGRAVADRRDAGRRTCRRCPSRPEPAATARSTQSAPACASRAPTRGQGQRQLGGSRCGHASQRRWCWRAWA